MNTIIAEIIKERQAVAERKRAWLAAEPRSESAIKRNERTIDAMEADIAAIKELVAEWSEEQQSSAAKALAKHGTDEFGRRRAVYFVEQGF